ncbi:Thioredoxinlike protein, partial [Globisporangium splendens]
MSTILVEQPPQSVTPTSAVAQDAAAQASSPPPQGSDAYPPASDVDMDAKTNTVTPLSKEENAANAPIAPQEPMHVKQGPTTSDVVVATAHVDAATKDVDAPMEDVGGAGHVKPEEQQIQSETVDNTNSNDSVVAVTVTKEPPREGTTRKAQLSLAQKRLVVQIQFVENARKKIEDETHPDMQSRLRKLERERDALLEHAKLHEEYLQHTTAVIFAYECDEATSEFEMSCEKLRQDMLDEIHHEMEIINDQRKGATSSARKTTRKTRSTRTKNGDKDVPAFALDTAQKIKKRTGNVFQPLEKKLAQSEVDFDLRELNGVFESSKKRRMEASGYEDLPFVKYHRGKLLYQDFVFQEGDEVFVQNHSTGSGYIAMVSAVTSTEVFVLSEKGKYYRLVITDLRQGKLELMPLTSEQIAALTAREERAAATSS